MNDEKWKKELHKEEQKIRQSGLSVNEYRKREKTKEEENKNESRNHRR